MNVMIIRLPGNVQSALRGKYDGQLEAVHYSTEIRDHYKSGNIQYSDARTLPCGSGVI